MRVEPLIPFLGKSTHEPPRREATWRWRSHLAECFVFGRGGSLLGIYVLFIGQEDDGDTLEVVESDHFVVVCVAVCMAVCVFGKSLKATLESVRSLREHKRHLAPMTESDHWRRWFALRSREASADATFTRLCRYEE